MRKIEHIELLLGLGNFEWRFRKTFGVPAYKFEEASRE
jgi:hypothetical protein